MTRPTVEPLPQGHFIGGYAISALNALGVMLTSVEYAKLKLNALVLRNPCEQVDQLLSRIGRHYIYQVRPFEQQPNLRPKGPIPPSSGAASAF